VSEFVDECRAEWRRLGVPDPVANEMAADLAADIAEAEAEGGSAEDVLGTSAFDPRHFAAAWAEARGVTAPPAPPAADPVPRPVAFEAAPTPSNGTARRRPVLAVGLTVAAALVVMAAVVLLVGRHSASAAVSVRRAFAVPGALRVAPGPPNAPPLRFLVHPALALWGGAAMAAVGLVLLVAGLVGLAAAVVYWAPWLRDGGPGRLR